MRPSSVLFFSLLSLAAFAPLAACSSSDSGSTSGAGGGSTTSTTSSAGGSTSSTDAATTSTSSGGPECDGPGYAMGAMPLTVDSVTADIVDLDGNAFAGEGTQLCGLDICLFGDTDGSGHVSIPANKEMDTPAFKWGNGYTAARLALRLPEAGDTVFQKLIALRLPQAGVAMVPGTTLTSGDLSLTVDAEGVIEVDEINFPEADQQLFRSSTVPADRVGDVVDPALGLEMLFAAGPFETLFCPAAKVSVPNSEGWAAGTAVELWLQGVDTLQHWAPYAGWTKVSTGAVSADGATIETTDGEGLPSLGVFGIKRAN